MESEIPFDYYWRNKMLANHHLNVNKIISIHFNSASLQLNIRSVLRQIDLNCNFIITCKVSDCTPVRDSSYIHFQSNCRCQILTCIGQGNLTISCDIYIFSFICISCSYTKYRCGETIYTKWFSSPFSSTLSFFSTTSLYLYSLSKKLFLQYSMCCLDYLYQMLLI